MSKLKKTIKSLYYRILYILPKRIGRGILYYNAFGKKLNLKNPKTFNEKIQWLIINSYGQREGRLADKYLVRDYVKSKGLESILPKVYGVYDECEEINLNKLPDTFVLKTNHGSGTVFICDDKNKFNFEECKKKLSNLLAEDFSKKTLEYHYHYIDPKIICEEYIKQDNKRNPDDYKIYCFNGKAECILVCTEREEKLKLDYYDLNWNYLNYVPDKYKSKKNHPKPPKLKDMINIAEKLSKDFPFVRVDLYNVNGKIYFGELTFTPASGLIKYNTNEAQIYLGKLINLKSEGNK